MKIVFNDLKDQVSILNLKDAQYSLIQGVIRSAANDISVNDLEYFQRYGADRGDMIKLFNDLKKAEDRLETSN